MRALFYWPDCTRQFVFENGDVKCLEEPGEARTVFWVSATKQEVEDHLADRLVNFNIAFRQILWDHVLVKDVYTFDGYSFYFFVPTLKRLTDPAVPRPRDFPYSKWKGSQPWLPIGRAIPWAPYEPRGVYLDSLDKLESLESRIRNHAFLEF